MGCITSREDHKDLPPISILNQDALLCIFSCLSIRDRCRVASVCRTWRRLVDECSSVWRDLDILPYEVNLHKRWDEVHRRLTPGLRFLRLGATNYKPINIGITKEFMLHLRTKCSNLRELEINGALLNSIDATDLPRNLKQLVVYKCSLRNRQWFSKALLSSDIAKLEHIDFDFNVHRLKENAYQIARDLVTFARQAKVLSLRNMSMGDLQFSEFPLTLKELSLWQCPINRRWFDKSVASARHVPQLTKLVMDILRHNSWTSLCSIGCVSTLVELKLLGADLRALDSANLPASLQRLSLHQVWTTTRWFRSSAIAGNLHQLKYLELSRLRSFSQKCATDFNAFPNLKQLHIYKSHIDDTGMAYAVIHLSSLENLEITNGAITDVSLALFGEYLTQLKQLRLRQCRLITDLGIQCLEDVKECLQLLEIHECQQITAEGVIKLASILGGWLKNLNVTSDIIGAEYCETFRTSHNIHLQVDIISKSVR